MKYFKKMVGERCYLSPMSLEDAGKYTEWFNDLEVSVYLETISSVITLENEKKGIERITSSSNDYPFAIVDKKNNQLIGNCGLHRVNLIQSTATLGIFIGDKAYWSKGFGMEAVQLVLDFGFNILNLHNIMLQVFEYNKRGIKCYEKCGFKEIGRRREARKVGGKRYDSVFMDILATEYTSPYVKKFLNEDV